MTQSGRIAVGRSLPHQETVMHDQLGSHPRTAARA
jgi:hypothetical protein